MILTAEAQGFNARSAYKILNRNARHGRNDILSLRNLCVRCARSGSKLLRLRREKLRALYASAVQK